MAYRFTYKYTHTHMCVSISVFTAAVKEYERVRQKGDKACFVKALVTQLKCDAITRICQKKLFFFVFSQILLLLLLLLLFSLLSFRFNNIFVHIQFIYLFILYFISYTHRHTRTYNVFPSKGNKNKIFKCWHQ